MQSVGMLMLIIEYMSCRPFSFFFKLVGIIIAPNHYLYWSVYKPSFTVFLLLIQHLFHATGIDVLTFSFFCNKKNSAPDIYSDVPQISTYRNVLG